MTTTSLDIEEELRLDFSRAGNQLQEARRRRSHKDTPKNRAAVADCLAWVDAILDVYLETAGQSA